LKQDDKALIEHLDKQWGSAATSRNLDDVVQFYAPNGTLVWPDQPPVHGTAGIRKAWEGMFQQIPNLFLQFTPERVTVSESGDLAADFGVVTMSMEGPNGPKTVAKYVVVWTKVQDAWKVLYDSWTYNDEHHG
jgi:ketosteroid isomerase-like protein